MQTKQTDLARLLMGTKVFVVPQFQRHYKWKAAQWKELWDDIIEQYESDDVASGNLTKDEGHFLGSVVLHPAPGPASTVSRYWVIDGQQRLTTLIVLIAALRDIRSAHQSHWDPNSYTNLYLANQYNSDDPFRLIPGENDRDDFISTVYSSAPSGQVGRAYEWFMRQLEDRMRTERLDFDRIQNAILLRLLIVEINTSDDDNINQIFNTINHSGMRLSAIDLIRNHSFMQFSADVAGDVYEATWKPMEDELGEDALSQYLWAQLVRGNPKATQRDLYGPFQNHLLAIAKDGGLSQSDATRQELDRLRNEVASFKIVIGDATAPPFNEEVVEVLRELQEWGSQTYIPLALEVVARVQRGRLEAHEGAKALRVVLAYLVRRGLAGIPSNNLNRILSALPYATALEDSLGQAVVKELLAGGKYWPRDAELRDRGMGTPIYLTLHPRQVRYILRRLNDPSSSRSNVHQEALSIERLLPAELSPAWRDMLDAANVTAEVAESRASVIGNLVLVESNPAWSFFDPEAQASTLMASLVPSNRAINPYPTWLPTDIDARSEALLRLAADIWPISIDRIDPTPVSVSPSADDAPNRLDVRLLLDAMPADAVIALDDLAQILTEAPSVLRGEVAAAGYPTLDSQSGEQTLVGGFSEMTDRDFMRATRLTVEELIGHASAIGADGPESL